MADRDTVELLRTCSSGVSTGVSTLSELLEHTKNPGLKNALAGSISTHEALGCEAVKLLSSCTASTKEPSPLAKGMSWLKTEATLALSDCDSTVASLVTDGCGMGIKTLKQSLNQFTRASGEAKGIATRLIEEEKALIDAVSSYL